MAASDENVIVPDTMEHALMLAAQAWCDKRTESHEMDAELATVFAEMLHDVWNRRAPVPGAVRGWMSQSSIDGRYRFYQQDEDPGIYRSENYRPVEVRPVEGE